MAGSPAPFEFSGGFIEAFARGVESLGHFEALCAGLDAETLSAIRAPRARRWWPGAIISRCIARLAPVAGEQAVQQAGYLSVKHGIAPFAMPLAKVTFALFGASPQPIFARAATFSATAMRGVDIRWTSETAMAGLLVASYEEPQPPEYAAMWRGTLSYVFELAGVHGTFGDISAARGGADLRIPVAWRAR